MDLGWSDYIGRGGRGERGERNLVVGHYSSILPVDANGATTSNEFGSAFRGGGMHAHFDPQTTYMYSDYGEVVKASTGPPCRQLRRQMRFGLSRFPNRAVADTD
jgi:hypothetical protein